MTIYPRKINGAKGRDPLTVVFFNNSKTKAAIPQAIIATKRVLHTPGTPHIKAKAPSNLISPIPIPCLDSSEAINIKSTTATKANMELIT